MSYCPFLHMEITNLKQLPAAPEIAVIINVGTKYVSTLALVSALRFAKIPTLLLDCESKDGSYSWFRELMSSHDFFLMPAPLRPHGETLDWIFSQIDAERILLVDSDAELLNDNMLTVMRKMLQDSAILYGAGNLHRGHWLERHYFSHLGIARGVGYYMERPWIPFTLLRIAPVRDALQHGRSFMHRLVLNDFPPVPIVSRILWERFRFKFFRYHRLQWLDVFRHSYNGEKPCYVSYDTGADIHEFLTTQRHLKFDGVTAGEVPWSVTHFSGITRGALNPKASDEAYKIAAAHPLIAARLRNQYGISI
jgi:hypothetical protein